MRGDIAHVRAEIAQQLLMCLQVQVGQQFLGRFLRPEIVQWRPIRSPMVQSGHHALV